MADLSHAVTLRKAGAALEARNYAQARRLCGQILKHRRNDPDALMMLAQAAWGERCFEEAISTVQRFVKAHPWNPAGYLTLGTYYLRLGRYRQAIGQFNKLLKQQPKHPQAIYGIAQVHELQGEHGKARKLLGPYVDQGTESTEMAFVYAKTELKAGNYDRAITVASRHAADPAATPVARQQLWFVIGQAHERSGDYDKAFEAYRSAHDALPLRFDLDRFTERIDRTIETFSAEAMAKLPRAANTSRLPVFIVCRPRSGSTLIERILASHPAVCAGGELDYLLDLIGDLNLRLESPLPYPLCASRLNRNDVDVLSREYLEKLQALGHHAERVTDKCLQTWEHLGLVSLLFPGATLIDLRRRPLDNCLSCYMTALGEAHAYNADLRMLGLVYRQYERLMEHWRQVLDLPLLRVEYEEVVADQESWSRRLIEFCGLPWDDRCLRFHEQKTSSTAGATASYEQVRRPIYKTSVDRAAGFQKHLGPLMEALGEG
ncbi:MAG: sulfotransferase [Phycisphaerales bacterium]|nr:MAG: sulfotransferase [Phycisphaerales bacterium]